MQSYKNVCICSFCINTNAILLGGEENDDFFKLKHTLNYKIVLMIKYTISYHHIEDRVMYYDSRQQQNTFCGGNNDDCVDGCGSSFLLPKKLYQKLCNLYAVHLELMVSGDEEKRTFTHHHHLRRRHHCHCFIANQYSIMSSDSTYTAQKQLS